MLTIQDSLDTLRGRLVRLKKQDFETLSPEIGVSHQTLKKFARGEALSPKPLQLIEAWCDRQESQVRHATH